MEIKFKENSDKLHPHLHNRFMLQECFAYDCLCVADKYCPAEFLHVPLSDRRMFKDVISDEETVNHKETCYMLFMGKFLKVMGRVIIEDPRFGKYDEWTLRINAKA